MNLSHHFTIINRITNFVEPLEPRIAPATLVNPTTVTYQDVDGDDVTVKSSLPIFTSQTVADAVLKFDTGSVNGDNSAHQQLQLVDLTALATPSSATGINLTITATRNATHGGDSFANIGRINATGLDLGTVKIDGDLADIDAGDNVATGDIAVKTLDVHSMGEFGSSTQPSADLDSTLNGSVSTLKIGGNLRVHFSVIGNLGGPSADQTANIGSVSVAGSVIGGAAQNSGSISASGSIGPVTVGGDVRGGDDVSGYIAAGTTMGTVKIAGSIHAGSFGGWVASNGNMGAVTVGHDVIGGTSIGGFSGMILSHGNIASVTIGGSLIGGIGAQSGVIMADGATLGAVKIGGDIRGGAGQGQPGEAVSGAVYAKNGNLTSLTVGGSIVGGSNQRSGFVRANEIGPVTIGVDLIGGVGDQSGSIRAESGKLGAVTLDGNILGGGGTDSGKLFSSLDMGAVKIGGDVQGATGTGSGVVASTNSIASVTLGGSLIGGAGTWSGRIAAAGDHLGTVKIGADVRGGDGDVSGEIENTTGTVGNVTIGGSVIGGKGVGSGSIIANARLGAVLVMHDVRSEIVKTADNPTAGDQSAMIQSSSTIASLTVLGSVIGNGNYLNINPAVIGAGSTDPIPRNGLAQIYAGLDMGPVKIGVDVRGGDGDGSGRITASNNMGTVSIGASLRGGNGQDSGEVNGFNSMGAVTIAGNIIGGGGLNSGLLQGGPTPSITLGGSLIGGNGVNGESGNIGIGGLLGSLKIGGDIRGGSTSATGTVFAGTYGPVTITGSIIGNGAFTGEVQGGPMGALKIGGDVRGGNGQHSGEIFVSSVTSVTVGGSVIGGAFNNAGAIIANGSIGPVNISHDLRGGGNAGSGAVSFTGAIQGDRIGNVTIGGNITAGVDSGAGTLSKSGAILSANNLGTVTVKGGLIGSASTDGDSSDGDFTPVLISARGQASLPANAKADLAIKSLSVDGRVEHADILAGYDTDRAPVNGDAQIGRVSVDGDWIASNLVAGVMNSASGNVSFGNANDVSIGAGNAAIVSKIASIVIGGHALGTVGGSDHYGFVAQQIGSLKVGGTTAFSLTPGTDDPGATDPLFLVGATGDLRVHEVS